MARTNLSAKTHEGAPAYGAAELTPVQQLRRTLCACLLWEKTFYEDGQEIGDRIQELAQRVTPLELAQIAKHARHKQNLRHAPLWLLVALLSRGSGTSIPSQAIIDTIGRVDEIPELLSLYWKNGRKPLAAQLKKGLAGAFAKFDAHQIAKYDRDARIKLRDVMFLTHPKPADAKAERIFQDMAARNREAAKGTWEGKLSGGADKHDTWETMLTERKLGYMALLRNLRNMVQANVAHELVETAIRERRGAHKVLPFRFIAAARHAPQFVMALDEAMRAGIDDMKPLDGHTTVLVDVSASMDAPLSDKSEMNRMDAACALAAIVPGREKRVFAFSNEIREVSEAYGLHGVDQIKAAVQHGGTYLGAAVETLNRKIGAGRLIVITDEQSHDAVPDPAFERAYLINVASYKNGVGYGEGWTHIDGWSEAVLKYIAEVENVAGHA